MSKNKRICSIFYILLDYEILNDIIKFIGDLGNENAAHKANAGEFLGSGTTFIGVKLADGCDLLSKIHHIF